MLDPERVHKRGLEAKDASKMLKTLPSFKNMKIGRKEPVPKPTHKKKKVAPKNLAKKNLKEIHKRA